MKFTTIKNSFFFTFLIITTILFLWLIKDFVFPIFWATVFGIVFYPLYKKILKINKNRPGTSSALSILLILLLILAPLYWISTEIAKEGINIYNNFQTSANSGQLLTNLPYKEQITSALGTLGTSMDEIKENLISAASEISKALGQKALSFSKNTLGAIASFFLMLYILFFTFRDGEKFLKRTSEILPMGDDREAQIFKKFSQIVRAIFKGTLTIALIQGLLGGILFWTAGISGVLVWTVIMTAMAVVPAVGPTLVLIPTGIYLLLMGNLFGGLILILGALFISILDNILRPILVGSSVKMHDVLITISIFGGLATFGITGFIIGPVIAGLFITFWSMFENSHKKDLKKHG